MVHILRTAIALSLLVLQLLIVAHPTWARPSSQDLPPDHPPVDTPMPERPSASQGITIYAESCAPCHGDTGAGDGPSATGLPQPPTAFVNPEPLRLLSPQTVFDVIKDGRIERGMPPWKNRLSDEAIWAVTAYLFDLNLGEEGYRQGEAAYRQYCASCHGTRGRGDVAEIANLDIPDLSRWPEWTNTSNRDWLASIQSDTVHAEAVASLSEEELDTVLAYVRSLTYSSSLAPFRGEGVLVGTVQMLTAGEEASFAGVPVTLFGFRGSMTPQLVLTTTVESDNTFRFENLSTEADALYSVSTEWEGVTYSSGVIGFPPEQTTITTTLSVAATTEEDPGLRAARVHWFIDFMDDSLIVAELIAINNPGDRAYIGQPLEGQENVRAVIRWPLPAGAFDIQVEGGQLGERFFFEQGALIDTLPVPPGNDVRRLLFQYRLPIERGRVTFAHPVEMPIAFLNVFVADRGEKIEAPPHMIQGTPQDVGGVPFRSYLASNIEAGTTITFKLSDISKAMQNAAPHTGARSAVRLVSIGLTTVLGIALFGAVFYLSRRRAATMDAMERLRQRRDALLEDIAALDMRFQNGELDEATYHQERDLLMTEAVRLTLQLGEDT